MGVNTTQSKFTDAYIGELLRDSINRLDQTSKTKVNFSKSIVFYDFHLF